MRSPSLLSYVRNRGSGVRIVHVITRINQGGTARWLDVLTAEQQRRGHDVLILSGNVQDGEEEDELVASLPVIKVPTMARRLSPLDDARAAAALSRHFRQLNPDLINTHTSKAGVLGRAAALSLGKGRPPVVHTIHGHLLNGFAGPVGTAGIRETEKALAQVADALICVGPIAYEGITQAGIGRGRPVVDILPGARALNLPDRTAAREHFGLADDEFTVAWVGRVTRQKNPDRALETARLMPDTTWLMAGDGDLLGEVTAAAPANVRLLGWSDPGPALAAADVYVHTADWEGFPYSVIEALQAGLRVVATDSVPPVPGVTRIDPTLPEVSERLRDAIDVARRSGREAEETRWRRADVFRPETFAEAHEAVYTAARRHRYGAPSATPASILIKVAE
jgi:glycosyltransferase involved in cell wall biosynthesis